MGTNASGQPDAVTILLRLEEYAHELSNSVGVIMNLLVRAAATDQVEGAMDDVQVAADMSIKSVSALKRLMRELATMRETLPR